MLRCPLTHSCEGEFKSHAGLLQHWSRLHSRCHGPILPTTSSTGCAMKASAVEVSGDGDHELPELLAASSLSGVAETAMAHIDEMKFRHYSTDADVGRIKAMVRDCLQSAFTVDGGGPSSMATTVLSAFDKINSTRREATTRNKASCRTHPPLQVYPRLLGMRTAGKRKRHTNTEAYAYDTRDGRRCSSASSPTILN